VGVYAAVSYAVARRGREIGIRMAVGATRAGVERMILRELAIVVLPALALGGVGAFAAELLLRTLLFGIAPHDFLVPAGACVLLIAVATVAAWLPARRAARLDPMAALRQE
jgi:ABC-type antimicrobial peptide transport system permease subunit